MASLSYIELTSPQLLNDKWNELTFDLASHQNVLQDCVMPESGSGYVYKDAKVVGSATHNRFLYWRSTNDIIEFVEMSTEANLEDNQVKIRFVNSPIVNNINVIEFPESIAIVLATMSSVHRLILPHPKTTNQSVLSHLTSDVLFDPSNYYILDNHHSIGSNKPISACSWFDKSMLQCALSFPDSLILVVQFGYQSHHITTSEIKQTGIIGRLWSRMPNFWAKNPGECENAIFASVPFPQEDSGDILLATLCRDCRIRVFSTNTKECVCSFNMIPQTSFHQSFAAHTNPSTELPMLRVIGSYIIIYLSENRPEFIFLEHSYSDNVHELRECVALQTPDWDKLLDFCVTNDKIWALANMCEAETVLCYMDIESVKEANPENSVIEGIWKFVRSSEVIEPPNAQSLVAEIFWRNHFSVTTIQKALVGIAGPSIPRKNDMEELEELALTRLVNDDQETAWRTFHEYCSQNHSNANKSIGLIASNDESIVSVVKRSNPTFICPLLVNIDSEDQDSLYRGIQLSLESTELIAQLDHLSNEVLQVDHCSFFEEKLMANPSEILIAAQELAKIVFSFNENSLPWFQTFNKSSFLAGISDICKELDLSNHSRDFCDKILSDCSTKIKSDHNPLASTSGMMITFEMFRRLVRARMLLARDSLIYICLLCRYSETEKSLSSLCEKLYTSGLVRQLLDSLRSYAVLLWVAECPIRSPTSQVDVELVEFVSKHFEFFKTAREAYQRQQSLTDDVLHRNLLMNFLAEGGVNYLWPLSQVADQKTLSGSYYLTDTVINLCKLLWPQSGHLCLEEFMFTQQLDEHLNKYIGLTQDWVTSCRPDRHFISATNYMLQKRANQAVGIFNRIWTDIKTTNLLGRFLELNADDHNVGAIINSKLINRYYDKLIELFQIYNNRQCLVDLINNCMSLLNDNSDGDQSQMMNSLRAKLFQFYLELEDPDEAYHIMVLTTDESLRVNCLRKFIVSHCEKEQWINLLSYPFIDIKHDFIDILTQKAESLDLSALGSRDFYKTSYYDLLFASYVMDEEYKRAAEVMYNYSQRLALEVPGITSIRKQADCLLIALNSLRSTEEKERYLKCYGTNLNSQERTSVLKRSHESCENQTSNHLSSSPNDHQLNTSQQHISVVSCQDLERKYELTKARLKLLERDQATNAIALSPLKPEETINQLVTSSLFSSAMDLAVLFRSDMEPILSGLAAKYVLVMKLPTVDLAVYQDIERCLTDIFTNSYSNIDTYNYVANSSSPLVDRLWRLIDYYLNTHDGVTHKYRASDLSSTNAATTVMMRVVATKLLSSGYDVPASLKRLYMMRNPSELLKLMMKYDRLSDACELAIEMIDRTIEPTCCLPLLTQVNKSERPPVYLPTHLILLLITYLEEDATDTAQLKLASCLSDRLNRFRNFVKSN